MSFLYPLSCSKTQFIIGVIQLLTQDIWIGWLWAFAWSILLFLKGNANPTTGGSHFNEFEVQNPKQGI